MPTYYLGRYIALLTIKSTLVFLSFFFLLDQKGKKNICCKISYNLKNGIKKPYRFLYIWYLWQSVSYCMLNLPLPDSAMAIQAANTDRQTDTDPHMVIVLLLVGTACYVSLYISVTIETYKHWQFVPRASNLLLYPCKFITLLQQQILTFLQQRMPATTLLRHEAF